MRREPFEQRERHVDPGARGPVVHADGQLGPDRNIGIEPVNLVCRGSVVGGWRHDDAVESAGCGMIGQFEHPACGIGVASREQRQLAAELHARRRKERLALVGRHARPFARRAGQQQAVHPFGMEPFEQRTECGQVEIAVRVEGRRNSGDIALPVGTRSLVHVIRLPLDRDIVNAASPDKPRCIRSKSIKRRN